MESSGEESFGEEHGGKLTWTDSDDEEPVQRASKRRRLNSLQGEKVVDGSDGERDTFDSRSTSSSDVPVTPSSDVPDSQNEKSKQNKKSKQSEKPKETEAPETKKSKYRIHIPKNSEIPKDAFYTQPPQRSSSPYRIDEFVWQKPKKSPPPSPPKLRSPVALGQATRSVQDRLPVAEQQRNEPQDGLSPPLDHPDKAELPLDREEAHAGFQRADHDFEVEEAKDSLEYAMSQSYEDVLADLPSDAFSSPSPPSLGMLDEAMPVTSQQENGQDWSAQSTQRRLVAPQTNLRQTTLFGTQAQEVSTQSNRKRNWPLANRDEPVTHHKLDQEAMKTWVFPMNLGGIRDYQYSIVARGLYHNLLVALPTGLGKTFIAATIMLNWFRWTTDAQIVFVAPTRPLVSQQVKACFDIAGIPRSTTTMLTGGISPGLRAEEWLSKRVFFMTPQTIINDLKTGICDPKRVVLLVVDEAHRATGAYAYVEVVKFLQRFNTSFRVVALTATPGADIEKVQEVIDGLGISRIEIRTEESIDIRHYVYSRKIETVLFDNSDEMVMVMELFARALQPNLDKLNGMNAYWAKDPMTLTPYGCNQARMRWMQEAGKKTNMGVKSMVNTIFSLLASLAHGIELLKFHGIGPFYHKVLAFRNETQAGGEKGSKYRRQINDSEPFRTMMTRVQAWINNPDFVGHPKLEYLQSVVLNHFLDAGDGKGASAPSSTRIMVFAHYRDSAEEIVRVLKRNDPMVRPSVFVGQADSKNSCGMDQKKQLEVIEKFKQGIYNTLVATSIGEEGLDIGEVDLIVCYDASASPIRMLQRMGRTGRKRAGNIVVTLMKGKEENNFVKAKDNYEKMQQEISTGTRFTFHDEQNRRIVPKDVQPVVDKRVIDIPPENTQPDLPEPKRKGRAPKRPPKKFHMPDGVRTGFIRASRADESGASEVDNVPASPPPIRAKTPTLEPIPSLEEVLLTAAEEREFERTYLDVKGDTPQVVEVPRLDAFPKLQLSLRRTKHVIHGRATKRTVSVLSTMRSMTETMAEQYEENLHPGDRTEGIAQAEQRVAYFRSPTIRTGREDVSGPKFSPAFTARKEPRKSLLGAVTTPCIDISSSDDVAIDENLSDVTKNAIGNNRRPAPSNSSRLPLLKSSKPLPFYQPSKKPYAADSDSGEDLPDFTTLMKKGGFTSAAAALSSRGKENISHRLSQRKGTRLVVDDSDDE